MFAPRRIKAEIQNVDPEELMAEYIVEAEESFWEHEVTQ